MLTRVTVVAGAIVDGRPVVLERYLGELWGHSEEDGRVHDAAAAVAATLEAELKRLGLEVRRGLLEENDA